MEISSTASQLLQLTHNQNLPTLSRGSSKLTGSELLARTNTNNGFVTA